MVCYSLPPYDTMFYYKSQEEMVFSIQSYFKKYFLLQFCPKSFAYRESLLTHVSQHTGLKRFMCPACGCRFSCITNLQAHRKSHINTCGQVPLVTKPVGPMVLTDSEAQAADTDEIEITKFEI